MIIPYAVQVRILLLEPIYKGLRVWLYDKKDVIETYSYQTLLPLLKNCGQLFLLAITNKGSAFSYRFSVGLEKYHGGDKRDRFKILFQ